MIFVTVGAQMPFDRLIRTVDEWAGSRGRGDIFAQIGQADYQPEHMRYSAFINPSDFSEHLEKADVIVAHAGMGSIITALERCKPILVMPRRSDLGETRNDHQIATARQFGALRLVEVAMDEQALFEKLDEIDQLQAAAGLLNRMSPQCVTCPFSQGPLACSHRSTHSACPHLVAGVHAFVAEEQFAVERFAIVPRTAAVA
jgi:UDP-N-acetylglucosamine transferase subunit ALG13